MVQVDQKALMQIAWLSIIVAASVSTLVMFGWISNWAVAANINPQLRIQIPFSTALVVLSFCASWLIYYSKPSSHRRRILALSCALLILAFCLAVLGEFVNAESFCIEKWIFSFVSRFGVLSFGEMSPLAAASLVIASVSLMLLISSSDNAARRRQSAAILAAIVGSIGFVIVLSYALHSPLLFGSPIMSEVLTTGLVLCLLGAGVCISTGPTFWPIRIVVGPSVKAQLLRAFLPLVIVIVVLVGWFSMIGIPIIGNSAVTVSSTIFLILIAVIFITSRIARTVDREILQTQDLLRENEQRFRRITENMIDMVAQTDLQGICEYASPSFKSILGYDPKDVLAKSLFELVHPDDLDSMLEIARKAIVESSATILQYRYRHADGHYVWLESVGNPLLDEKGQIFGTVLATRDITERKRAEEELQKLASVVRYSSELISLATLDGQITFLNEAGTKMLGIDPEEVQQFNIMQVIPDHLQEKAKTELLPVLMMGGTWEGDLQYRNLKTNQLTDVHAILFTVKDPATGKPLYLANVSLNITERKQIERMKDQFTSMVSHELRTPLTAIRASLGLLASGVSGTLPEKGQRMLEIAVTNTDRLVRLINDILDSERLASGKTPMEKKMCNAAQLVTQAAEVMKAMATKADVSLSVESQDAVLLADPDRIAQALTNLISNAIKFSIKGGRIWVTAERKEDQMLFRVQDEGRGIPQDKLGMLFERFQQVDASDAREKGGTGLGLSISKSIVEQHNGRIWIESTVGKGSTFLFTLPLPQETQVPSQPEATTEARSTTMVLIIEDDPDLASILATMLQRHDIQPQIALTGAKGITLSKQIHPDMIVLDLGLPDMDGSAVVQALREDNTLRLVPLVVYTVRELNEQQRENLRLGETLFFTKSRIPPDQFEEKVVQFMKHILENRGRTSVS